MSKEDVVASARAAILQLQDQALVSGLGQTYDQAFGEGVASVPPADADEQAKIDAAVAAQKAADQAVIDGLTLQVSDLQAKDASDLQSLSDAQAHVDSLQVALDAMTAQDMTDKALVGNLKGAISAMRTSLDAIQAALDATTQPAPEPVPVPEPAPVPEPVPTPEPTPVPDEPVTT